MVWGVSGCATPSPVWPGIGIRYAKAEQCLATNDPAYATTLQVRWLGTACYLIQLGDRAIFTDPFLTHQSLLRVALGGSIKSNPNTVSNALVGLPVPQSIFVGHSHYDHMLDAAECLKQPGWGGVPIYGSASTRNLLRGYGGQPAKNGHLVSTNCSWQEVAKGIRYQAMAATHGRQLPLLPLLYGGAINKPRRTPPARPGAFKVGDTYAFVFELSNEQATNTIYFTGAAHRGREGFPDPSVTTVDVALLCVPTWKRSPGYPSNIISRLKPRHIVTSHYDNFFQVNQEPTDVVPLADMDGFLIQAQRSADYPEFEDIMVPAVGAVLRFKGKVPHP
jgi:L-ascorbate metabolism protein UlaG (beta-lactamase superfamily)